MLTFMRRLPALVISLAMFFSSALCEEPSGTKSAYPLWDSSESAADYAKRVNLPATKTLDLGDDVKLELVLIPAATFTMGTPNPTPVDEESFQKSIVLSGALFAASAATLLIMLTAVTIRAIRKKRRPQLSLIRLTVVTLVAGSCVLSGLHWRKSARGLEQAKADFAGATARNRIAKEDEKPAHPVTLTNPYYMGKFVVTQEQWQQVTKAKPANFSGNDVEVTGVSWIDAQAFCRRLSGLSHQSIRLPTEAEWEHACRAGTTTMCYAGDTEADLARVAWYDGNSKKMQAHPVGKLIPNAFGLYDILGDWQWCEDWYGDYSANASADPQGPAEGEFRAVRGGNSCLFFELSRSAHRYRFRPDTRQFDIGFRVVADAKTP